MIKRAPIVSLMSISLAGCVNSDSLSGDVYTASRAKQIQNVAYSMIVHVHPVQTQGDGDVNVVGAIGGAILGGFLDDTTGGGTGRSLATVAGTVADGAADQGIQGAMNEIQGVELEIRKDDGNTAMVVQKQGATKLSTGQRVVTVNSGSQVIVSPH